MHKPLQCRNCTCYAREDISQVFVLVVELHSGLESSLLPSLHLGITLGEKASATFVEVALESFHHVATDGEPVGATIPVGTLIARCELAVAEDLVRYLLSVRWDLGVGLAAVDQQGRPGLLVVFLRSKNKLQSTI